MSIEFRALVQPRPTYEPGLPAPALVMCTVCGVAVENSDEGRDLHEDFHAYQISDNVKAAWCYQHLGGPTA